MKAFIIILFILLSIILGILLSPVFMMYKLTKSINWKILKDIYKYWFNS